MSVDLEARILIVEDQREVARVLRTALELSHRGFHVIDVLSGEEALLEMGRTFDLVISDYRLPGMNGAEFLRRVTKVQSGVKVMMITAQPIDVVKKEVKGLDLFGIYEKPVDTDAFVEAVKRAVGGETSVGGVPAVSEARLGDIPEYDDKAILAKLESLQIDLGAQGAAFINRAGKTLIKLGAIDDVPRFGELAVLLANNFTTTAEISAYLGDAPSTPVHYYDGTWYDMFAVAVGIHFFIVFSYSGDSQNQMGVVLRFGKPGANEIASIIGDEAFLTGEDDVKFRQRDEEFIAEEQEEVGFEEYEEDSEQYEEMEPVVEADYDGALMSLFGDGEEIEAIDLDFEDLDLNLEDDIDDIDGFWEEAGTLETKVSDDALSMEEAVELGLISKDTDIEEEN